MVNRYSKYMALKSVMEDVFGVDAWYALKESNHIPTWRKYAQKLLKSIEFSINDTVEIYDEEWMQQIDDCFHRGSSLLKSSEEIDEIIAVLAGVLANVSFLQIGHMPRRKGGQKSPSFRKGNWKFDSFRSVVYLQTKEQQENLFLHHQYGKIGPSKKQDLRGEYYRSKSKLSFSKWCKLNGHA